MEKRLLILLLPLLFLGCAPYASHWRVWKGNYDYMNGRYQPATVAYLRILEEGSAEEAVIHYNLGNVFYALGETAAAEEEWRLAREGAEGELLFRTLFNQGNLYFELSQYAKAYASFRDALTIRPESMEAKRNLELSLQKLSSQETSQSVRSQGGSRSGSEPSDEVERILQYIQRKEESQWVSQEQGEADSEQPSW